MSNLQFDSNWRRALLLQGSSEEDVDRAAEYILLDEEKLSEKIEKFCEKYSFMLGFDYDPYSYLIWPMHDSVSSKELIKSLNNMFPKCASMIRKTLVEAHGLVFISSESDLAFGEDF